MVARLEKSLENYIERLGYVLGENDVLAVSAAEHLCEHLTCLEDSALKVVGSLVSAAVYIGAAAGHIFINSIGDFLRLRKRSRTIVEIDFVHCKPLRTGIT